MTDNDNRMRSEKFPTKLGEGYRVGDTYYLYTRKPLVNPNHHIRDALDLPPTPQLHNQTESFRKWAIENNIPVPKDLDNLYNYVLTIGDAHLPTVWPSRIYMRKHQIISATKLQGYAPRIVYTIGTPTMCRFGHKKYAVKSNKSRGAACNTCRWWRDQGVDLSAYTPTHCLVGHPLKDNRWLSCRRGKISEHCVKCNNDKVTNKYGYTPAN